MENDEKQSKDLPKYRLRATAMKTLLANAHQEGFTEQSSKLFSLLISNNDARASVFAFCQTPHPLPLVSNIMDLLYDYFSKDKSISNSESQSNEIFQYLIELINKQLPSSFISKVDFNSLSLIDSASHLASLFPSGISQYMSNIPTNQHQVAFLLSTLSYFDDISEYISQIQPLISPKTPFSTLTFSELKLLSKHEGIENVPPVKTLISFCKSLPENEIFSYAIPTILCVVGNRLQTQNLKEIPAFITYLIKKSKKDAEHIPDLCSFIDKVFEFPDSITLLRPLHEDLVTFFITNAQLTDIEISDELKDPTIYGNKFIIKSFLNFVSKFGLDPFDCLMQTRDTSIGTLILAYSSADSINIRKEEANSNNNEENNNKNSGNDIDENSKKREIKKNVLDVIESFLNPLISQIKQSFSPSYQFLIRVCGICANKFSSRASLRFLVSAISLGSNVAYDYLINGQIPFELIFPEIVNNFKPGRIDALYIQALQVLLQVNQSSESQIPILNISEEEIQANDDLDFDYPSNFAKLSNIKGDKNEINANENDNNNNQQQQQLSGSPTTETILFCNVASSVLDFPEYFPLLGPSASTISHQFAIDFIANIQKYKEKGSFKQGILSAYSNSISSLDIDIVYNLASTFLMISQGQSMLFLGISLQRLPNEVILESLQKVTPYSHSSPIIFGKMVALVAHSHPSIALSFIESFISSSATKRRVFFIFKTSETSEETLITVFYIIGYCSIFIESSFFIEDFLPFATSFMSKYLVSTAKNQEVSKSSLFAIQKVCTRVQKYQEENKEHSFNFKDFLENYVNSLLKSEVDKIMKLNETENSNNNNESSCDSQFVDSILLALASLVPLRPVFSVEKLQPFIEYAVKLLQNAKEKTFCCMLESIGNLCSRIIESNSSFQSLVSISLSIFPSFLRHQKWVDISRMMNEIYEKYIKKINSFDVVDIESTTKNINSIIVDSLPLALTDECDHFSSQILHNLITLFTKRIRNNVSFGVEHSESFGELKGEKLSEALFDFLSKSLLASQVFEIISKLLNSLKDEKVLLIHHKNIALTIKYLFEMKGIDYHQFDPRIVSQIFDEATSEKVEVSSILLETIEILSKKNLESILSVLVSPESPLNNHDEIFDATIKKIVNNEKSAKSLVSYLASTIYSNVMKKSTMSFCKKVFPLLSDAIKEIDDETWSKLFIGIVKQTNSIDSLFLLFDKKESNLFFYARETAMKRPSSLPLILSFLPEKVTPFVRKLALSFALFCQKSCTQFIQYAIADLNNFEKDDAEILILIFRKVDNKLWKDLSQKLIVLILDFISKNEIDAEIDPPALLKSKTTEKTKQIEENKTDKNKTENNVINFSNQKTGSKSSGNENKPSNDNDNDNNNDNDNASDLVKKVDSSDLGDASDQNKDDDENEFKFFLNSNFSLKFSVSFLKNADDQSRKLFWDQIVARSNENIRKYATVFLLISFDVDIDIASLIPIIPKLVVSSESSSECLILLHRIYDQIKSENENEDNGNGDDNDDEISDGIAMMLLKLKALSRYKAEFLAKFVEMMIHGDYVSECIRCISSYITGIDEGTADVIETLIMQLPKVNETDQKQISLMLQKVLI